MGDRRSNTARAKLALCTALLLTLAACAGGDNKPCDYSDPIGPCATSHGQTHGG